MRSQKAWYKCSASKANHSPEERPFRSGSKYPLLRWSLDKTWMTPFLSGVGLSKIVNVTIGEVLQTRASLCLACICTLPWLDRMNEHACAERSHFGNLGNGICLLAWL